jgi:phenylpyruvate tautomerase PptA (4-oxalocrotonate tautomerase family)
VKTSVHLTQDKKEELKSALGQIITLIPGKTESVTMVGLLGDYDLYYGGVEVDKGAYVEVKMYKTATTEAKAAVNEGICNLLKSSLAIDLDYVYITFFEQPEWGFKGNLI